MNEQKELLPCPFCGAKQGFFTSLVLMSGQYMREDVQGLWEACWQFRQSEIDALNAKVAKLQAENAKMREALEMVLAYATVEQGSGVIKQVQEALAQKED